MSLKLCHVHLFFFFFISSFHLFCNYRKVLCGVLVMCHSNSKPVDIIALFWLKKIDTSAHLCIQVLRWQHAHQCTHFHTRTHACKLTEFCIEHLQYLLNILLGGFLQNFATDVANLMFASLEKGMLNVGIGPTEVNTILGAMNIPGIHHKSLKQRERSMGGVFESSAKQSCKTALMNECNEAKRAAPG